MIPGFGRSEVVIIYLDNPMNPRLPNHGFQRQRWNLSEMILQVQQRGSAAAMGCGWF